MKRGYKYSGYLYTGYAAGVLQMQELYLGLFTELGNQHDDVKKNVQ